MCWSADFVPATRACVGERGVELQRAASGDRRLGRDRQQRRGQFFIEGEKEFHALTVAVELFRVVAEVHGAIQFGVGAEQFGRHSERIVKVGEGALSARGAGGDSMPRVRDRKNFRLIWSARIGENQSCNRSANISLVFLTRPMRGNILVTVSVCSSSDMADMASSAKI